MFPDLTGQTLGRYRLIQELGRGGTAVVFRAEDPVLDRTVAVKVLVPQAAWTSDIFPYFEREARGAARLKHPNIITVFDVGEWEGHHFIVMEYVDGSSLDRVISIEGPLPPLRTARIIEQVASALDYAHARGMIHRDIKPANILLSDGDQATLMDFGLVRSAQDTRLTRTGTVLGTLAYIAPEQASGEGVLGPAADIYGLGVVAYEMLSGHVPFESGTPAAVLFAHVHEPAPPLRMVYPGVSPAVEAVVGRALAKVPSDRYLTAGAFAAALRSAAAEPARSTAPIAVTTNEATLPFVTPVAESEVGRVDRAPSRRSLHVPAHGAPYFMAVAAFVALALIALMVFLKKGVDEPLAAARATDEAAAVALAEATGEKDILIASQNATAAAGARQTVEAEASAVAPAGAIIQRKPAHGATVGCVQFEWDVPDSFKGREDIVYKILVCDTRVGGNGCVPQAVVRSPRGYSEYWDPGKAEELNILGHNFSGEEGVYRWKVEAQGQAPLPGESQVWSFTWNGGRCGEPTRGRNDEWTDDGDPAPHATEGSEGF